MLSRVADSIYWLNRYLERVENYARFIEANFQLSLDMGEELTDIWMPLVLTTADVQIFKKHYAQATRENVIEFLTFNRENVNSIFNCLHFARENTRSIREKISTEMWEALNELYTKVKDTENTANIPAEGLQEFFRNIRRQCHTFYGISDATICHDEIYHFGMLGRYIERADKTTRIVDLKSYLLNPKKAETEDGTDLLQWVSLLKSASAYEMFTQQYLKFTAENIAEFLLLHRNFPRAILFCIKQLEISLRPVSQHQGGYSLNSAERKVQRLLLELRHTTIDSVFEEGLHNYLDRLQKQLNEIGAVIEQTFFIF